jgi:hypothetical protein
MELANDRLMNSLRQCLIIWCRCRSHPLPLPNAMPAGSCTTIGGSIPSNRPQVVIDGRRTPQSICWFSEIVR